MKMSKEGLNLPVLSLVALGQKVMENSSGTPNLLM